MLKALGLFCGYITLALVTCVVAYLTQADRVTASPKECTADPSSCPVRTFCYLRGLDAVEYFPGLFDARDASNNTIWDEATIDQDDQYEDGKLFGVCACYALYGEGGENPIPGGPASTFCEESEGYRDVIMIAVYVCLAITALSVFNQYMTMYALYRAEALLFNASGITMVLVALAATMESWLIIVYLIEVRRGKELSGGTSTTLRLLPTTDTALKLFHLRLASLARRRSRAFQTQFTRSTME